MKSQIKIKNLKYNRKFTRGNEAKAQRAKYTFLHHQKSIITIQMVFVAVSSLARREKTDSDYDLVELGSLRNMFHMAATLPSLATSPRLQIVQINFQSGFVTTGWERSPSLLAMPSCSLPIPINVQAISDALRIYLWGGGGGANKNIRITNDIYYRYSELMELELGKIDGQWTSIKIKIRVINLAIYKI